MRPVAWAIAAALALAGASAEAQISNLQIRINNQQIPVNALRPLGRLDCESNAQVSLQINYLGDGSTFNALQFWIGAQATSCTEMATRHPATNAVCWPITSAVITGQQQRYVNNEYLIPARFLVDPLGGNCATPTTPSRGTLNTNFLSLLVVSNSGTVASGMALGVPFDLDPPATPMAVSARPGEGSVEVSWSYPSPTVNANDAATTTTDDASATSGVVTSDLKGFWVLCDPPAAADAGVSPDAGSADGGGGLDVPGNVLGGDAGAAGCGEFPSINLYDNAQFERYRRSGITSNTSTRLTVTGLANGASYRCAVVAEDNAGNRTISSPTACVSPVPVTDFWERYRSDGGAAVTCAARGAPPTAPDGVALALSLAAAALAARRRRKS